MVRWYHAIFTAYGFWLPNDPRGSWSEFVGAWELYKFGGTATTTDARQSVAHDHHDVSMRRQAKQLLNHPPVHFGQNQRDCIAAGISQACTDIRIRLLGCAIGYDHVHGVLERHAKSTEEVIRRFKSRATQQMTRAGCHPMKDRPNSDGTIHTPWAEVCWNVFINDEHQLNAAINYVNRHPEKEGLPTQTWPFVVPV